MRREECVGKIGNKRGLWLVVSWAAAVLLSVCSLQAASIARQQAEEAVGQWLAGRSSPLETPLGHVIEGVEEERDEGGAALFYVVRLSPQGFVVVAGDDEMEPIVAFSAGRYGAAAEQPLRAVLRKDMGERFSRLDAGRWSEELRAPARVKWQRLQRRQMHKTEAGQEELSQTDIVMEEGPVTALGMPGINDLRVAPLVQSEWGQGSEWGLTCYNYYTPNHYPSGCATTATAQLMRYNEWPVTGIGVHSNTIYVNGVPQTANTRGGDGSGGAYLWPQMPLDPPETILPAERQAIGALCYDVAVMIGTDFTADGSGASLQASKTALVTVFGYGQAVIGFGNDGNITTGLIEMMNPNLDAGQPLLLGIAGTGGAHAVVADGYGYDMGTVYHHINFGWNGSDDAWYALPNVNSYTNIGTCIYNVTTGGGGEIVSGRVTDAAGNPLAGVEVTCKIGGTVVQQVMTNARGIYALCNLAKQQTYTITAAKSPYGFLAQQAVTGWSQDYVTPSGNVWGVDFASVTAGPPTAYDGEVDVRAGTSVAITLLAADDLLPDPPGQLEYVIVSLPGVGTLADPNGGVITTVPYTLVNYGNTVLYTGCPYFDGEDGFGFQADDGGAAPQGGASNTATVTMNVDNHIYTTFEPDLYTIADFPFHSSSHDARIQSIYHPDELGGAQTITALSLKVHKVPGQTLNEWTIRMQHTNWTDYGAGDFLAGGWTTVYQGTEPAGSTGWRTFTFQTPFVYNGTQNLLVDFSFDNTYGTSDGFCFVSDPGDGIRSYMDYANSDKGDPLNWDWAGWYAGYLPNLKLISTVTAEVIPGDVSRDCRVDLPDAGLLAAAWLSEAGQPEYRAECDISPTMDGVIDLLDFAVLAENWLRSY